LREQNIERDNAGPELELCYDIDLDDELQAALDEAAELAAARPPAATAALAAQAAPDRGALAGAWASAPGDAPSAAGSGAASLPLGAAAGPVRSGPQRAISPFALPAASGSKAPLAAQASVPSETATATNLLGAIAAANGNGAKPARMAAAAAQLVAAKGATPTPKAASASTAGAATTPKPAAPLATGNAPAAKSKPAAAAHSNGTALPAGLTAAAPPKAATPGTAGASIAKAANSGSAALSNDDVQRIYTQYLSARKQNAERVDNVKLDSVEKTLRGMLPQLEKKHAGKKIDFEVVVKDGKVALKPVAR
jgi:hypothetical protein